MHRLIWVLLIFTILIGCSYAPGTHAPPTLEVVRDELLIPWTAERADSLIQRLSQPDPGEDFANVDKEQEALHMALQEALWAFPQAPQTNEWRWLQTSLQAKAGLRSAAPAYAPLISEALTAGNIPLQALPDWLREKIPSASITLTEYLRLPDREPHALLELKLDGLPAYYWISPQDSAPKVIWLGSGREFRTNPGVRIRLDWQDLTGDGSDEAWVITTDLNQRIVSETLAIYDLALDSPQRLTFSPALPSLMPGKWGVLQEGGITVGLQAALRVDGGSALCEYLLPVEYRLQGSIYQRTAIGQPALADLVNTGFSEEQARLCLDLVVDWLRANASSDDLLSLQRLEAMMPGFPYGSSAALYVGLYPPDEPDRARFELGLNYARRGDVAGVQRWMSAIIDQPAVENSPWQTQAQAFLEAYQPGADLRRACLASRACLGTGRLSLGQLVSLMQTEDWTDPIAFLQQSGAVVQQSGKQDIALDGLPETWWLENSGGASEMLLFLTLGQDQPWLSRLSLPAGTGAIEMQPLEPLLELPVYRVLRQEGTAVFVYVQSSPDQAPEIWTLDQYRTSMIQLAYQSVLQETDESEYPARLRALQTSPYFNCKQPSEICQPSAQQAYLVALLLERTGDTQAAAAAYRQVWEAFPDSSFAILARARMAP